MILSLGSASVSSFQKMVFKLHCWIGFSHLQKHILMPYHQEVKFDLSNIWGKKAKGASKTKMKAWKVYSNRLHSKKTKMPVSFLQKIESYWKSFICQTLSKLCVTLKKHFKTAIASARCLQIWTCQRVQLGNR